VFIKDNPSYLKAFRLNNSLFVEGDAVKTLGQEQTFNYKRYLNRSKRKFTLGNTLNVNYSGSAVLENLKSNSIPKVIYTDIKTVNKAIMVENSKSKYLVPQVNGFQDMTVQVVSGNYAKISISSDGKSIVDRVVNLPSTMAFNRSENTIEGIPFVLGKHYITVILNNKNQAVLTLDVISGINRLNG
jgi:hypothetical protein